MYCDCERERERVRVCLRERASERASERALVVRCVCSVTSIFFAVLAAPRWRPPLPFLLSFLFYSH